MHNSVFPGIFDSNQMLWIFAKACVIPPVQNLKWESFSSLKLLQNPKYSTLSQKESLGNHMECNDLLII